MLRFLLKPFNNSAALAASPGFEAGRAPSIIRALVQRLAVLRYGRSAPKRKGEARHSAIARQAISNAIVALTKCGRFDEVDHMARRGLEVFPQEKELLVQYALNAHHAGHYADAIGRWEQALQFAPERAICHAGLVANLRETQDYVRAQSALDVGRRAFPKDHLLLTEAARLAASRGDFRTSLLYWEKVCAKRKPHPDWLQGHAQSLVMLGRFDAADAALKMARAKFPDHMGLCGVEGLLASAREDWPSAIAHWQAYRRRYPQDTTGWEQLGSALQGHQFSKVSSRKNAIVPELPFHPDVVEDESARQLLLRFESIGDNCEFGLVQRRYGAEPLGLLRWNTVDFDQLVEALRHRLQGMGDDANTEIDIAASGEYYVYDRRWSLGMHTFLHAGQTSKESLYTRMCRRVTYLRDKMLSDLADADKIFVFRSAGIDTERFERLHLALSAIGPVTLLAAQAVGAASPFSGSAGDILKIDDRRFVGFLSREGRDARGNWNIAFDDWLSICGKVAKAAEEPLRALSRDA